MEPIKASGKLRLVYIGCLFLSILTLVVSGILFLGTVELYGQGTYYILAPLSGVGIFLSTILIVWFAVAAFKGQVIQWGGLRK